MNPANAVQTISPFPTPPEYAQMYGNSTNEAGGSRKPQPPPVQTEFTVFGEEYRLDDEIISKFFKFCLEPFKKPLAALLFLQTVTVFLLALVIPFLVRLALLSTHIHQEVPLELTHPPCNLDFRSCPFPSARIPVDGLLVAGNHYQFSVRMHCSEEEIASRVGLFSNEINIFDVEGNTLGRWKRAGLSKNRSLFSRLFQTVLSFYVPEKSFFHHFLEEQNALDMTIVKDFYYNPSLAPAEVVYTLQDHYIHFDEIYLVIQAKVGYVAHFYQYWPIVSFIITAASIYFVGFNVLLVFWSYKAVCYYYSPHLGQLAVQEIEDAAE